MGKVRDTAAERRMVGGKDLTDTGVTIPVVTHHDRESRLDEMTGCGYRPADELIGWGTARITGEVPTGEKFTAHQPHRPVDRRPAGALRGTWNTSNPEKVVEYKARSEAGPVLQQNDGDGWTDVRSFASRSIAARQGRVVHTRPGGVPARVIAPDTGEVLWESATDAVTQWALAHGHKLTGKQAAMSVVEKAAADAGLPVEVPTVEAPAAESPAEAPADEVTVAA